MSSSLLLSTTFTTSSCTPSTLPFITQPSFKTRTKQAHGFRVSCKASPKDNENQLILPETQKLILPDNIDRRNLLMGLGGLYAAANIASLPSALADPIKTPDLDSVKCEELRSGINNYPDAIRSRFCRPPKLGKVIKDYVLPDHGAIRMRWPAHDNSNEKTYKENVEKYKKGIYEMRKLDKVNPDHPHSFSQQAKIHCAYCNGGYTQVGFPEDKKVQIHNSWLFFPFHRWYLYFYERIIGKLIHDDTFALPYWNWDNPAGMTIPEMFIAEKDNSVAEFENKNPIFDKYREKDHLPPQAVNLFFNPKTAFKPSAKKLDSKTQKACNLSMVYRDLISNGSDWRGFFGGEYKAGQGEPRGLQGSVEGNSHTSVHIWVGDSKQDNREDMGNFYSAGYDPLFYVHHANVDRMWKLWKDLKKDFPGHEEPTSDDWLHASYIFYDENEELVRVYNKNCVNLQDLKYDYAKSDTPWLKSRPTRLREKSKDLSSPTVKTVDEALNDSKDCHLPVDPLLKVRVIRPKKNRTAEEKKQAEEKLFITGIEFSTNKFVKFDVFVNDNVNTTGVLPTPCDPQFAGCYAQIPHNDQMGSTPGAACFGLNELLEDTQGEDDEYALVALVARAGCEDLTVSGIKIDLVPYN